MMRLTRIEKVLGVCVVVILGSIGVFLSSPSDAVLLLLVPVNLVCLMALMVASRELEEGGERVVEIGGEVVVLGPGVEESDVEKVLRGDE